MGMRPQCCDRGSVKKGLWTLEEDAKLHAYVSAHGTGNWTNVPKKAGLKRCGKSCRLRWTNYLRPNLKHEGFTPQEEDLIIALHAMLGSRWAVIAKQLPGRTDNDVKNYWNTKLSKKLALHGIDPVTHRPISEIKHNITALHIAASSTPSAAPASRRQGSRICSLNRDLKNILNSRLTQLPPLETSSTSSTATKPPEQFNSVESVARALPPPPPPKEQLEWAEYLAEDAFLCFEEQDAHCSPAIVAAGAACGMKEEEDEEEVSSANGGTAADGLSTFVDEMLDRDREMMAEFSGFFTNLYFL